MKFLADENLSRRFVNAITRHDETIEVTRVPDVGLLEASDEIVFDWASQNGYVLVTKDRATIPALVEERLITGEPIPRILVIRPHANLRDVVSMISLIAHYSLDSDWQYPMRWIP